MSDPVISRKKKQVFIVSNGKPAQPKSIQEAGEDRSVGKPADTCAESSVKTEKPRSDQPILTDKEQAALKKKRKAESNWRKTEKALLKLEESWPELFTNPPRPLAIGINDDLKKTLEDQPAGWLKRGISCWCNKKAYRAVLAEGGHRYGLKGIQGEVTPEQQQFARESLNKSKKEKDTTDTTS